MLPLDPFVLMLYSETHACLLEYVTSALQCSRIRCRLYSEFLLWCRHAA